MRRRLGACALVRVRSHCLGSGEILVSALGDENDAAKGGFLLLDQELKVRRCNVRGQPCGASLLLLDQELKVRRCNVRGQPCGASLLLLDQELKVRRCNVRGQPCGASLLLLDQELKVCARCCVVECGGVCM